jgi:hypothetical protein
MEFKVLIYILIGIGYFLYTTYRKKLSEMTKKSSSQPPKTVRIGKSIDEILEQMTRPAPTESRPIQQKKVEHQPPSQQPVYKPKQTTWLQEKSIAAAEEGNMGEPEYVRPLTAEEILHNERMRAAHFVNLDAIEDDNPAYQLNVREALIGSIILERKF